MSTTSRSSAAALRGGAFAALLGGAASCTSLIGIAPGETIPEADAGVVTNVAVEAPACEANLRIDPMHCGRCGHDCAGGECVDGVCRALELAELPTLRAASVSGLTQNVGLFVRGDVAYVTAPTPGRPFKDQANSLLRISADGAIRTVTTDLKTTFEVTKDALYDWACGVPALAQPPFRCTLRKRPLDGSGPPSLLPVATSITYRRAVFGGGVYPPALAYDETQDRVLLLDVETPPTSDSLAPAVYEVSERGLDMVSPVPLTRLLPVPGGWLTSLRSQDEVRLTLFTGSACDGGPCAKPLAPLFGSVASWCLAGDRVLFYDQLGGAVRFASVPFAGGPLQDLAELPTAPLDNITLLAPPGLYALSPAGFFVAEGAKVSLFGPEGGPARRLVTSPSQIRAVAGSGRFAYWVSRASLWRLAL